MSESDLENKRWFVLRALAERWMGLHELSLDFFEDDVPGVPWRDMSAESRIQVFRAVAQTYLDFFRDGLIEVAKYDNARDEYHDISREEAESAIRLAENYYLPRALEYRARATGAATGVLNRKKDRFEIPSESDWGDYSAGLNLNYAHKMFAGKTYKESIRYLVDGALTTTESLYLMPAVPFRYYIQTYIEFLTNTPDEGRYRVEDVADDFLWILQAKLERNPEIVLPAMGSLMPVVQYLAENAEEFAVDVGKVARIEQAMTRL